MALNLLRYGRGRPQSVPLQKGLAAAIRAATVAAPPTAIAALDFLRFTESQLAEAVSSQRSSSPASGADRCSSALGASKMQSLAPLTAFHVPQWSLFSLLLAIASTLHRSGFERQIHSNINVICLCSCAGSLRWRSHRSCMLHC